MIKNLFTVLLLSLFISITACTTATGPVAIREAGGVSHTQPAEPHRPPAQPVAPVVAPAPSSLSPSSPLKDQLIQQSEKKLSKNDAHGAIALAERGLRIDRKEPRFYQVLAAAYHSLKNTAQSIYFAKQGLRYASKGTETYQALKRWAQ